MKYLLGFITLYIFIVTVFIACWLYFDFPISTNDEKQNDPKTQQMQQKEIRQENQQQNNTEQQAPATIPSQEKSPQEFDESQERKSEIQALQENDKDQDWKEKYNEINEGSDENPYVIINGKPVDPKHVTGKENNYE